MWDEIIPAIYTVLSGITSSKRGEKPIKPALQLLPAILLDVKCYGVVVILSKTGVWRHPTLTVTMRGEQMQ